jgi:sporulation protein YlmC with PRC-barrel domain
MTKKLMIGAAIGALMVSSALAQSPSSSTPGNSTPPVAANTPAGKADVVTAQKPDQWLASKFKGTDVIGSDDQKIGDVSDILFDKSGNIQAYVISIGGVMGIGAKEVALAPKSFTTVPGQNGGADKLKVSMTNDDLKNAQTFARYEPPRPASTTGSGPAGLNGLSGSSGGRPATGAPPASGR